MKNSSPYEIAITAEKIRHLLDPEKLLIINDHLDIALATANGVHLGQSDLPLPLAKKIAPQHFIMGATCHNATEISQALDSGASYISVGCLFETKTKINTTPISVQTFNTLTEQIPIPVCAIGGIHFHNIHSILFKQTHMVALCGAVWDAPDPTQALDDFVSLLECRKAADPIFT
jgi:thiamine-phosphate pyrophosphorylase